MHNRIPVESHSRPRPPWIWLLLSRQHPIITTHPLKALGITLGLFGVHAFSLLLAKYCHCCIEQIQLTETTEQHHGAIDAGGNSLQKGVAEFT